MKESKRSRDFDKLIIEAVQERYSFFAWQSVGGVIEKCELRIKAYRKNFKEIELELCKGQELELEKVVSGNRILNIYVPGLSISFSSELKSISAEKEIKIYSPTDYTFFERRRHERVHPTKTCYVSFEHNNKMIKKSIYDFSFGGIAIILPKSDKLIVEKGKKYNVFNLEIGLRKIQIKAECVNATSFDRYKVENLPYGGYKIAFRFTEMTAAEKTFLTDFVVNELLHQKIQSKAI
jgi:hypothetical protein